MTLLWMGVKAEILNRTSYLDVFAKFLVETDRNHFSYKNLLWVKQQQYIE